MEEARWVVHLNLPISIGVGEIIGLVSNGLGGIEIIYQDSICNWAISSSVRKLAWSK